MKGAPMILVSPCREEAGAEFGDESLGLSNCYSEALVATGAIPLVLPRHAERKWIAEAVRRCQGVMLTGGEDVQVELYRTDLPPQVKARQGETDPLRDRQEMLLIEEVFEQSKPLLAICRGHQLLNVALGGTLWVDIATEVPQTLCHTCLDQKDDLVHSVAIREGSVLASIIGSRELQVNSAHHQAIATLAPQLRVTAVSPDGIIEAVELSEPSRLPFLLGVQFHPERLFARHEAFFSIFNYFSRVCARARE